jgi:general secretion pathway protein M
MRLASPEHARSKALGLLALALALLYLLGLHWWWSAPMRAMGQQMEQLRDQELRLRMRALQRPQIERRLAAVRRLEANNPGFLPEASVELASAGLTQRLESLIASASPDKSACTITQRTPTPDTTQEAYQRVVVQVRMLCGMGEFSAFLHEVEGGRPQLFVDNLNIVSRRNFVPDAQQADNNGALDISFNLYGYLRPGGDAGVR